MSTSRGLNGNPITSGFPETRSRPPTSTSFHEANGERPGEGICRTDGI